MMLMTKTRALVVLALGLQLWAAPVAWAHDYFLKIDSIAGSSTQEQHDKWIEIDAFSWTVLHVNSSGGGAGGGAGKTSFSELSWQQAIDAAVVPIFLGVAKGTHYKDATLDVVAANQERAAPFFQMVFKDVQLTQLQVSGSGGATPKAEAALDSSEITMRYWTQDAKGQLSKTPIEGTWSLLDGAGSFSGDINVLTGLFLAGATSVDLSGLPLAVPEPGSWALMLIGLGLLGWRARRVAG